MLGLSHSPAHDSINRYLNLFIILVSYVLQWLLNRKYAINLILCLFCACVCIMYASTNIFEQYFSQYRLPVCPNIGEIDKQMA